MTSDSAHFDLRVDESDHHYTHRLYLDGELFANLVRPEKHADKFLALAAPSSETSAANLRELAETLENQGGIRESDYPGLRALHRRAAAALRAVSHGLRLSVSGVTPAGVHDGAKTTIYERLITILADWRAQIRNSEMAGKRGFDVPLNSIIARRIFALFGASDESFRTDTERMAFLLQIATTDHDAWKALQISSGYSMDEWRRKIDFMMDEAPAPAGEGLS